MTNIVERLRKQAWQRSGAPKMDAGHAKMLEWEAADEIERLREEVEVLRGDHKRWSQEVGRLRAKITEMEEERADAAMDAKVERERWA